MEINEEDALIEVISGGMDESDQFSYSDQEDAVRPDYVNGKAEDIEIEYESWRMFEGMWKEILSSTCFEHEVMEKCLQFCYLFPRNYEFHKDDIVQLWMAQGFFPVPSAEEELMENIVRLYFEEFERGHIFRLSGGFDSSTGQLRYRLNHSIVDLLQEQHYDDYLRLGDPNSQISENIVHSSVPDSSIDSVNFKKMYQAKQLSTLLIFHEPGYRLDQVPRELFLKLPLLRILDLSHTSITELPSSIGKLKDLRYLNLSETPITALPDSLCTLYQLQTLKLRNCLELVGLPDDMRKLKNLRHLDMDPACLLVSMPPGFGDLTQLQSLPAFVVGKENGCHITELRHMVNIGGTLRILRLENVSISEEAKEAALDVKVYLQNLELQWTELQDGLMVLENLKPHTELGELQIIGYGGAKFPSWIGDPFFSRLVTISIHDCRNCELLPPLGRLPLLCDLCISEMHEVKVIDHQFCGRDMDANFLGIRTPELGMVANNLSNANMFNAFPRLEKLTLNGLPKLEKWIRMEDGDFPHLRKLNISGCSKLTTLPKSSLFKSLHQLVISFCPSLESFPQGGLLTSLQYLAIIDCPLLKEQCQNDQEEDCRMLAHVPNVWIDYQQFSPVSFTSSQTQNTEICSSRFDIGASVQTHEDFGHQAGISGHITGEELPILLRSGTDLSESNVEDTGLQQVLKGDQSGVYPTKGAHTHLELHPSQRPTVGSTLSGDFEIERRTTTRSFLRSCFPSRSSCFSSRRKRTTDTVRAKDPSSMESKSPLEVSSPFRLSVSPKVTTIGSVHLSMKQVIKATKNFSPSLKTSVPPPEDIGHQAGSSNSASILPSGTDLLSSSMEQTKSMHYSPITSPVSLPTSDTGGSSVQAPQLEEIIPVEVTELQPHLDGNKKLKDPSTKTKRPSEGGYNWRSIPKWSNISKVVSRFVPKWKKQSRNNTQQLDELIHVEVTELQPHLEGNKKLKDVEIPKGAADMDSKTQPKAFETPGDDDAEYEGATTRRARNLNENESWSLFCDVAFSADQKRNLNSEFETVGKDIAKKCQGILLAIKAVAGLLATKTESPVQWEMVNSNFRVNNNESIVFATLELSYDDLPAMLKHCILCFSIYPKGTLIDAEQLIYWWVGEGFVHGDDRKTAIEVAFQCLSQLVSRCLVEVYHYRGKIHDMFDHYRGYDGRMHREFDDYRGYDGKIYKCRMHDMVQDFIVEKSRIEGFSSSGGEGFYCRHLGYTSKMDKEILGNYPKLRAFLSVKDVSPSKLYTGPDRFKSREEAYLKLDTGPDRIKSLRVLDLSLGRLRVDVGDLLSFIESQMRLAYLNLTGVGDLTELPDSIKEHRNLKILVLNNLEKLPSSITTLHNLLVLDVTDSYGLKLPPGFGGLTKLQVLRGFRPSENLAELRELKNLAELRELTIILYRIDEIVDCEECFLSQLSKLKVLTIQKVSGTLLNRLKLPPSLKELNLESCLMDTNTPDWLTPASLPKLVYLNIDGGFVEGVNPSFWEGNGEGWRIEGLCFNYLYSFKLDWEVVKSTMKYLRYAEVRWCPGLKSFPLNANNSGVWDKEEESESRLQSREQTADYGKGKKTAKYAKGMISPHQLSSQYGSFA